MNPLEKSRKRTFNGGALGSSGRAPSSTNGEEGAPLEKRKFVTKGDTTLEKKKEVGKNREELKGGELFQAQEGESFRFEKVPLTKRTGEDIRRERGNQPNKDRKGSYGERSMASLFVVQQKEKEVGQRRISEKNVGEIRERGQRKSPTRFRGRARKVIKRD